MAMSLANMRAEIRSLVNEEVEDFFLDDEIDSWLNIGAIHVSSIALHNCERVVVHVPANELTSNINQLPDAALSGTPRVLLVRSGGIDAYLKVYPTYGGVDAEPDPDAYRTYDDGGVSGAQRHVGFRHGESFFWTGANAALSPSNNPTADVVCGDPYVRTPETSIYGTPAVFGILSGGTRYYFKGYTWAGCEISSDVAVIDPGIDFMKIRAMYVGTPTGLVGAEIEEEDGDAILLEDGSALETEGGSWLYGDIKPLVRIRHNMIGHLINVADFPIYYAYWAGKIYLYPAGSYSFSLLIYPAQVVSAAADLPYSLQFPCMSYAMAMAHLKDDRLSAAIDFLMKSSSEAYFLRESLYFDNQDGRRQFGVG